MTPIVAAFVTGMFALAAAIVAIYGQRVRRDLDQCLRDRRQLRQSVQLIVGSLVGLLAPHERDRLLVAVASALEDVDGEAA